MTNSLIEERKVYAFISSTFNDMHSERDYLFTNVFPYVKNWCFKHGLRFIPVDLRWGIPDDLQIGKSTLQVCLENIEKCNPIFINLLGQRYGWVPSKDDISEEYISRYPKLKELLGQKSITELEILRAIDCDDAELRDSIFLIRDNFFEDDHKYVPEELCLYYDYIVEKEDNDSNLYKVTVDMNAYKNQLNLVDRVFEFDNAYTYDCRIDDEAYVPELKNYKAKINDELYLQLGDCSKGRLCDFSIDGKEMRTVVIDRIIDIITKRYGIFDENVELTEEEKEINRQENYLFQLGDNYVEPYEYGIGKRFGRKINNNGIALVDEEEGGYGSKSSFCAYLIRKHPENTYYCFCGISPFSKKEMNVVNYIIGKLQKDGWLDGYPKEIKKRDWVFFPEMLNYVSSKAKEKGTKVTIIFDGLERLVGSKLYWTNSNRIEIDPDYMELIFTIGEDDKKLREKCSRFDFMYNRVEYGKVIEVMLATSLKSLSERQKKLIQKSRNKGFLFYKMIVHEVLEYGSFNDLDEYIEKISSLDMNELIVEVIDNLALKDVYLRYDFSKLVHLMMSFISLSEYGVEKQILIKALAKEIGESEKMIEEGVNLVCAYLSDFLFSDDDYIDFKHSSWSKACKEKYSSNEKRDANSLIDSMTAYFFETKRIVNYIYLMTYPVILKKAGDAKLEKYFRNMPFLMQKVHFSGVDGLIDDISLLDNPDEMIDFRNALMRDRAIIESNYFNLLTTIMRSKLEGNPVYSSMKENANISANGSEILSFNSFENEENLNSATIDISQIEGDVYRIKSTMENNLAVYTNGYNYAIDSSNGDIKSVFPHDSNLFTRDRVITINDDNKLEEKQYYGIDSYQSNLTSNIHRVIDRLNSKVETENHSIYELDFRNDTVEIYKQNFFKTFGEDKWFFKNYEKVFSLLVDGKGNQITNLTSFVNKNDVGYAIEFDNIKQLFIFLYDGDKSACYSKETNQSKLYESYSKKSYSSLIKNHNVCLGGTEHYLWYSYLNEIPIMNNVEAWTYKNTVIKKDDGHEFETDGQYAFEIDGHCYVAKNTIDNLQKKHLYFYEIDFEQEKQNIVKIFDEINIYGVNQKDNLAFGYDEGKVYVFDLSKFDILYTFSSSKNPNYTVDDVALYIEKDKYINKYLLSNLREEHEKQFISGVLQSNFDGINTYRFDLNNHQIRFYQYLVGLHDRRNIVRKDINRTISHKLDLNEFNQYGYYGKEYNNQYLFILPNYDNDTKYEQKHIIYKTFTKDEKMYGQVTVRTELINIAKRSLREGNTSLKLLEDNTFISFGKYIWKMNNYYNDQLYINVYNVEDPDWSVNTKKVELKNNEKYHGCMAKNDGLFVIIHKNINGSIFTTIENITISEQDVKNESIKLPYILCSIANINGRIYGIKKSSSLDHNEFVILDKDFYVEDTILEVIPNDDEKIVDIKGKILCLLNNAMNKITFVDFSEPKIIGTYYSNGIIKNVVWKEEGLLGFDEITDIQRAVVLMIHGKQFKDSYNVKI